MSQRILTVWLHTEQASHSGLDVPWQRSRLPPSNGDSAG